MMHRLHAAAIDLRRIGGILKAERQRAGEKRRQNDAEFRKNVIEEEKLHQKRSVAKEFDNNRGRPGNQFHPTAAQQRKNQPQNKRDGKAGGGCFQRYRQADQNDGQDRGRVGDPSGRVPFVTIHHD
ncbi:hypothetical protein D3C71_1642590 [compost metagenome]